jgi:anti-sigma B factor antagonist
MPRTDEILASAGLLPPPFTCTATHGGLDAAWVHVTGELDIATAPELGRALLESQQQARLIVLDLRELAFIDCAGVHIIVDASLRARKAGRRLILVRGRAETYRVFRLTGCSDDVDIGDPDLVQRPIRALQRSLVARSLLKSA